MKVHASRKIKVHETNYPIHDLELAAVVFTFKIWRHYLYGVHVDVLTDHNSLQYVFTQKELNLQQKMWLELLKDYDMSELYHPGKANIVGDALSRMTMGSVYHLDDTKKDLEREVHRLSMLGVRLESSLYWGSIVHHNSESSLVVEVISIQHLDLSLKELKESVLGNLNESFSIGGDGVLRYQRRLCVPYVHGLRYRNLEVSHGSRYSIHPGLTKMYMT